MTAIKPITAIWPNPLVLAAQESKQLHANTELLSLPADSEQSRG